MLQKKKTKIGSLYFHPFYYIIFIEYITTIKHFLFSKYMNFGLKTLFYLFFWFIFSSLFYLPLCIIVLILFIVHFRHKINQNKLCSVPSYMELILCELFHYSALFVECECVFFHSIIYLLYILGTVDDTQHIECWILTCRYTCS